MKKEKIDFNVNVVDAFGEVVKESKDKDAIKIGRSIVNILSRPDAIPEGKTLDGEAIVKRLLLQQKIASKEPQEYTTNELAIIQETVVNLYNKRMLNTELAGAILKMTN